MTPALFAEVGRSSSSVFTRWTRCCARRAEGRCGSSRSSPTTMSWMRSCDTSRRPGRNHLAAHRARHLSQPFPESLGCSRRLCGVCSGRLQRGQRSEFGGVVTGQGSEFGGAHRFERPIDACELAPGLENTPQRLVSLESNKRNFLFLHANRSLVRIRPDLRQVIWPENQIISEKTSPCALLPTRARGDQVEVPGKGAGHRLCTRPSSPPTLPATAWRPKLGNHPIPIPIPFPTARPPQSKTAVVHWKGARDFGALFSNRASGECHR